MGTSMAKRSRWMKWVLAEADSLDVEMPWSRRVRSARWKTRMSVVSLNRLKFRA